MSVRVDYGPMTEIQMQLDEVAYIESQINQMPKNGIMVEWGSGGSTVKWLETLTDKQKLITVEHNPQWRNTVIQYLSTRPELLKDNRFKYIFKPELYGYEHGYAHVNEEHPHGLDDYIWPKVPEIKNANIYLIDGIARATVALLVKMYLDSQIWANNEDQRRVWHLFAQ